jgi:hypothetical protein
MSQPAHPTHSSVNFTVEHGTIPKETTLTIALEQAELERLQKAYQLDQKIVTKYPHSFNQWLKDTLGEWAAEVEREVMNQQHTI